MYAFVNASMRATRPVHLNLLHLITLTDFDEEYTLRSFSSCNFLQPAVPSSLLGQDIPLSTFYK